MEFGYRTMEECCSNVMHDTPDPSIMPPASVLPTAEPALPVCIMPALLLLADMGLNMSWWIGLAACMAAATFRMLGLHI